MQEIVHFNLEEQQAIRTAFTPISIPKGGFFIQANQYCNQIGYLSKGRLRIYYLDEQGNEITCHFTQEGQFVSSYTSFLTRTPTKEYIEAIEDCELYVLERDQLEKYSMQIPKLHIFRRIIAENLYLMMERRISMLQSRTAQERYEDTLKNNPELLLHVPLQYTASFLGITPQHLSRLRKKAGEMGS